MSAIRAGHLGIKTILVERDKVGGVCLNYGCIPTKALLSKTALLSEIKRGKRFGLTADNVKIDFSKLQKYKKQVVSAAAKGIELLLKSAGVKVIHEEGVFLNECTLELSSGDLISFNHAIIAAGSRNLNLPGIYADNRFVYDSTGLLELEKIPKSLLVIGGGAIGLELGLIFNRLGTEVTVVEMMEEILPGMDRELAGILRNVLFREGMKFHTGAMVKSLRAGDDSIEAQFNDDAKLFRFEKALLSAGRLPNIESLKNLGLELQTGSFVKVDSSMRTSVENLYAIGDVAGPPLLAHKASHQGITAVEAIAGHPHMTSSPIPSAVFTEPEFASVGLTLEQAESQEIKAESYSFPLRGLGRAKAMGANDGAFKIITNDEGKILGAHILAPNAGDLIAEAALAIKQGLSVTDLADTIHVHPTLSEGVMEAALLARGKRIHI